MLRGEKYVPKKAGIYSHCAYTSKPIIFEKLSLNFGAKIPISAEYILSQCHSFGTALSAYLAG